MVDASLSISAPRSQAAVPRAVPSASAFADALPAGAPQATAASPPALPPGAGAAGASSPSGTTSSPAAGTIAIAPVVATAKPAAAAPSAFHVLLSELNPLQYVPVVGTIYRAVTGDTIPEAARIAGGLVVSGLTGGPVGIAMNVGATLLEHIVGIDPEKIGDRLLAELGIGHAHAAPTALASAAPPAATSTPTPGTAATPGAATTTPAAVASPAKAWSPAQLAAYGVTGGAGGTLRRGTETGADVLNSLELARIAAPVAA